MTPPYRIETDAVDPLICRSLDELDATIERLQQTYVAKGPTSVIISEAAKEYASGDPAKVSVEDAASQRFSRGDR